VLWTVASNLVLERGIAGWRAANGAGPGQRRTAGWDWTAKLPGGPGLPPYETTATTAIATNAAMAAIAAAQCPTSSFHGLRMASTGGRARISYIKRPHNR
jgi:hypothetical protein